MTFSIDLSAEEGGGSVELVKNGRDMEVNATNVYNYVRKYSQYRYKFVDNGFLKIKFLISIFLKDDYLSRKGFGTYEDGTL